MIISFILKNVCFSKLCAKIFSFFIFLERHPITLKRRVNKLEINNQDQDNNGDNDDDDENDDYDEDYHRITKQTRLLVNRPNRPLKKKIKCSLNLAPEETNIKGTYQPYNIYLGHDIFIELKSYRQSNYLGFYKKDPVSGDIKNRFNIPLEQLLTLKKALVAVEVHLKQEA